MPEPACKDKAAAPGLQLLFRFAYAACPHRHAAQAADGTGYVDALLARVMQAFPPALPYAVSLAARTDRGVGARDNACSLRLRWPTAELAAVQGALAEVMRPRADGLLQVRGRVLARRTMVRASAGIKTYTYALQGRHAPGPCLAAAQGLLRAFAEASYFGRYCAAAATHLSKVQKARPRCEVQLCCSSCGQATLTVRSQALLKHQVRHMAAAVQALLQGSQRLPKFVAALAPPAALEGPVCTAAPAKYLTLQHIELPAALWP